MPGATAVSMSGGVRTRQNTLAVAAAGQPSSSMDSQGTTCGVAVHAAASPGSMHTVAIASGSKVTSTPLQQNTASDEHVDGLQQQPPSSLHKSVQAGALTRQQPVTTRSRSRINSSEGSFAPPAPAQQSLRQQQHSQSKQDTQLVDSQNPSMRNRTRSAAATAPPAVRLEDAKTSQRPRSCSPRLREASTQRQQQLLGAQQQQGLQQAAAPTVMTRRRARLPDSSNTPDLKAPPAKRSRRQQAASTAAAASATNDQHGAAVLRQAAAAAAANNGCKQETAPQGFSSADAAEASASPGSVAPSEGSDTAAAAADAETDIPHTSLRARFARLSAEQQLSILVELQHLTDMEDARRARQEARLAAAAARKQKREAVRGQERRSGRHRELLDVDGEGLGSRTGTPDAACGNTPEPAAAAKCNNGLPEAMHKLLQATAAATADGRDHGSVALDNNDAVDTVRVSALAAAAANCAKKGIVEDAAELCATASRERNGNKRARTCSGRGESEGDPSSPEPAAAAGPADLDHVTLCTRGGECHHDSEGEARVEQEDLKAVPQRRLGVRAQARKRKRWSALNSAVLQ